MKSLFEELGGACTPGKDGMYYPNPAIEETDQRLILSGTMGRHLADANERATIF